LRPWKEPEERWTAGVRFPAGAFFSLFHSVQTVSSVHPASYPMGNGVGGSFPRGKAAGEWNWSLPPSAEVKKGEATPSLAYMSSWHEGFELCFVTAHKFMSTQHLVLLLVHMSLTHCYFHYLKSIWLLLLLLVIETLLRQFCYLIFSLCQFPNFTFLFLYDLKWGLCQSYFVTSFAFLLF
jgi:hypothetical protein